MPDLVTIDPGVATGISLGSYGDQPYKREEFWLIKNGVKGFCKWWWNEGWDSRISNAEWVSEAFILSGGNEFTANLEPVKIEGAFVALGIEPIYQLRTDKALCKDEVLKSHGLWVTGKMCEHVDGRDVNDSTIHALARMKKLRHLPSLKEYWP